MSCPRRTTQQRAEARARLDSWTPQYAGRMRLKGTKTSGTAAIPTAATNHTSRNASGEKRRNATTEMDTIGAGDSNRYENEDSSDETTQKQRQRGTRAAVERNNSTHREEQEEEEEGNTSNTISHTAKQNKDNQNPSIRTSQPRNRTPDSLNSGQNGAEEEEEEDEEDEEDDDSEDRGHQRKPDDRDENPDDEPPENEHSGRERSDTAQSKRRPYDSGYEREEDYRGGGVDTQTHDYQQSGSNAKVVDAIKTSIDQLSSKERQARAQLKIAMKFKKCKPVVYRLEHYSVIEALRSASFRNGDSIPTDTTNETEIVIHEAYGAVVDRDGILVAFKAGNGVLKNTKYPIHDNALVSNGIPLNTERTDRE